MSINYRCSKMSNHAALLIFGEGPISHLAQLEIPTDELNETRTKGPKANLEQSQRDGWLMEIWLLRDERSYTLD
jgi:hypothetical protein